MSSYRVNPKILDALIGRKVESLGADTRVIRDAQTRLRSAIRQGANLSEAIRETVSWAAARTDRPAERRRSDCT